jgi:negative regulator of flagellin synthesis FlgM
MVQSVRPQDASGIYRRTLGGVSGAEGAAPARSNGAPGRARRTDSVALSEQARLLARALEVVEEAPDARAELVTRLRAAVEDGTYRVDANQIAARLLQASSEGATAEGVQA